MCVWGVFSLSSVRTIQAQSFTYTGSICGSFGMPYVCVMRCRSVASVCMIYCEPVSTCMCVRPMCLTETQITREEHWTPPRKSGVMKRKGPPQDARMKMKMAPSNLTGCRRRWASRRREDWRSCLERRRHGLWRLLAKGTLKTNSLNWGDGFPPLHIL